MLWIEIAFPHLGARERGPLPVLCLGLYPNTEPLLPRALPAPKPAPTSFQGAASKENKQTLHRKQPFEEHQFFNKNKALTPFTHCEGEKGLDLFILRGACTHKDTHKECSPRHWWVFRGLGTEHRCLHRQNEGRTKSHRVIVVFYPSSWLF